MIVQRGHVATFSADQMMVGRGVSNFINSLTINFGRYQDIQIAEKGQSTVHRSPVDVWCRRLDTAVNITGCCMTTNRANCVQDNLALRGHAAALFADTLDVV